VVVHKVQETIRKKTLKRFWMLFKRSYILVSMDGRASMPSTLNGHASEGVLNGLASPLRPSTNRYVN
jgi:hypothetical protein